MLGSVRILGPRDVVDVDPVPLVLFDRSCKKYTLTLYSYLDK